jgi:hypothetical protein
MADSKETRVQGFEDSRGQVMLKIFYILLTLLQNCFTILHDAIKKSRFT